MVKSSKILTLTSLLIIPSISLAKPSQDYEELVKDYKKKLGELRKCVLKVRTHPEFKNNLYGPDEKEFSKFEEDEKKPADDGTGGSSDINQPASQGNWPLRIVLSLLGGGAAMAIGSYWMPETALPIKRSKPVTDELYQDVKRKYHLDDEDDY